MKSETKNVLLVSLLASTILLLIAFGVRKYLNQFPQVAPIGVSAIPATDAGKRALLNSFNPDSSSSSVETKMVEEEHKAKLDVFMPSASSTTPEKTDEEKLKKLNAFTQ